ncbi:MAG: ArnT family glycosyltransferase [Patescibacteria group bacterium UBA2163]
MSVNRYLIGIILIGVIIAAFVLRFAAFDHPLSMHAAEGFRDLFVAKHALIYNEWPLSGHHNGLSTVDNSPLYYYLIIGFALFTQSFFGVSVLFIIFQTVFVALVFLITRALFNSIAGLVAAFFLAFSPHYIITVTSDSIWPPYFAATFVVVSLWLLWRGDKQTHRALIIASPIAMLMAVAIHQATLALAMPYAALGLYVAYRNRFLLKHYLIAGGMFLLCAGVLFLPSLLTHQGALQWGTRISDHTVIPVFDAFHLAFSQILYTFGLSGITSTAAAAVIISFITLSTWFIYSSKVLRKEKVFYGLGILFLVTQICIIVFFDPEGFLRHMEPALWILTVLLGVIITAPFIKQNHLMMGVSLIVCLVTLHAMVTDERMFRVYPNIGTFEYPHYQLMDRAVDALVEDIRYIKEEHQYTDYTFFNIHALSKTGSVVSPLVFWFPLEERLDARLEKSPNTVTGNFWAKHVDDYLFYACFKQKNNYSDEQCLSDFSKQHTHHNIEKQVFYDDVLSIYRSSRLSP